MTSNEVQANKALVAQILRAYGQGDLRPLMAALDEAVTWEAHARPPHYRFGGQRTGHAGVSEVAALIAAEYAVQSYKVKELVAEGEVVWALSEAAYIHNETSMPINITSVTRWLFRDGRVVEFHGFFDSASVLAQQGRLAAE
jgi:ketosteroid isomerase-like protein